VSKVTVAERVISTVLAQSPTGSVVADHPDYHTGDTATIHVALDAATSSSSVCTGHKDPARALLGRRADGPRHRECQRRADGLPFTFTAPDHVLASELHGFVVTKLPSLDLFALELLERERQLPAEERGHHAASADGPLKLTMDTRAMTGFGQGKPPTCPLSAPASSSGLMSERPRADDQGPATVSGQAPPWASA